MTINREVTVRFLWIVFAVLIVPSISLAAYQNPTVTAKSRLASGQTKTTFQFTGNAGEPTVTRDYVTSQGVTNIAVREWVADTMAELNSLQTVDGLTNLQVGATPTPANRVVAAKTAKQTWREKYATYIAAKDSVVIAIAADLATLKADIEATYQAGFLTE